MSATHIYYGASTSAVPSWLNFDASLTVRVQNLPVVGRPLAKLSGNGFEFPVFLKYGDIIKGLPVPDASADGVYASHVLEHLSLEDLRERARRYVARVEANPDDAEAAPWFVRDIELGEARALGSPLKRLRAALGPAYQVLDTARY